jgi:PadR family transcriptional regulator PadR
MAETVRFSGPTLKVLKLFVSDPAANRSGAEISRLAGIGSGTLYPLLARLEHVGWLKSKWEVVDPSEVGRPRRRFYKITGVGQKNAVEALTELQAAPGELIWIS